MSRYNNPDCKVYVGDLGSSATREDIEDAFRYYGPLRNVWVARNPPGFAFVEFEDHLDAEDAVKGLDGRSLCGRRARVELSRMRRRRGFFRGGGHVRRGRGRPFNPQDRCYECGNRGHYARDCRVYKKGSRRDRSYSRSRSRSVGNKSRSKTRSRSRTSRSRSRSASEKKRSHSRGRSRSVDQKRTRTSTESEGNTPVIENGDRSN